MGRNCPYVDCSFDEISMFETCLEPDRAFYLRLHPLGVITLTGRGSLNVVICSSSAVVTGSFAPLEELLRAATAGFGKSG